MVFQSNYIDPKTKSEMKVAVKGIKGNVVYVRTFIYNYIINQLQIKSTLHIHIKVTHVYI